MKKIAPVSILDLKQARDRARRMYVDLLDDRDPFAEKSTLKVSDLAREYLEKYAQIKKRSWKQDRNYLTQFCLKFGRYRIDSITRLELQRYHDDLESPYSANRLIEVVRSMYQWAITRGLFIGENPASGIEKNREEQRERFVHTEEIPALMSAIDAEDDIRIWAAFQLLLRTGCRVGEILAAKWEDITENGTVLEIPHPKNNRKHYVALSEDAQAILCALPGPRKGYIFPGQSPGTHRAKLDRDWHRIRERAAKTAPTLSDIRIHDLRHTVASWLAQSGYSLPIIGQVLNHKDLKATARYSHLTLDTAREALETGVTGRLRNEKHTHGHSNSGNS